MKIHAPFTDEQKERLAIYQINQLVHPYTCSGCDPCRVLNVTTNGLKCPFCNHEQQWAFDPIKK